MNENKLEYTDPQVLHRCVILSLVELKFYEDPRGTARGTSQGALQGLCVDCLLLECCFCQPGCTGIAWV